MLSLRLSIFFSVFAPEPDQHTINLLRSASSASKGVSICHGTHVSEGSRAEVALSVTTMQLISNKRAQKECSQDPTYNAVGCITSCSGTKILEAVSNSTYEKVRILSSFKLRAYANIVGLSVCLAAVDVDSLFINHLLSVIFNLYFIKAERVVRISRIRSNT